MSAVPWTEERSLKLSQLWMTDWSAAEIGRQMGISKNAVVGRAHRLNLPQRPSPIKRLDGAPPTRRRVSLRHLFIRSTTLPSFAEPQAAPPPVIVVPKMGRGECCWPIGEPRSPEFHFCGAQAEFNRPYCADCRKLAYRPMPPAGRGW
jgi:GcrA cell cycle regulator